MKSPFPGMDPYLELEWRPAHTRLIVYLADQLTEKLAGTGLRAVNESTLMLASGADPDGRPSVPDVKIHADPVPEPAGVATRSAIGRPAAVLPDPEGLPHRFVQIEDEDRTVITVVELVSPTNKEGARARRAYVEKRERSLAASINVVEIDLTRRGDRTPVLPGVVADHAPSVEADYLGFVGRTEEALTWEVYPIALDEPLPPINVPLRYGEDDVVLELQPPIERTCRMMGTARYSRPLVPPLPDRWRAWAARRLRALGIEPVEG